MPWMTVEGNHERNWPGTGDGFNSVFDSGTRRHPDVEDRLLRSFFETTNYR